MKERVVVSQLMEQLVTEGLVRSQLMGLRPACSRDLAEIAAKGGSACTSCVARLQAVVMSLTPDEVGAVFGLQAQVVQPTPLWSPRVIEVGSAADLQVALDRLVMEEGVLVRTVSPFHEDGVLYAVVT